MRHLSDTLYLSNRPELMPDADDEADLVDHEAMDEISERWAEYHRWSEANDEYLTATVGRMEEVR